MTNREAQMGEIRDSIGEAVDQLSAAERQAVEQKGRGRLEIVYEEIELDRLLMHYVHGERIAGERIEDWSYFYDVASKTVILKKFVRKEA